MDKEIQLVKSKYGSHIENLLSTLSLCVTVAGFVLVLFYAPYPGNFKFFKLIMAVLFGFISTQAFKLLGIYLCHKNIKSFRAVLNVWLQGLPSTIYITLATFLFFTIIALFPDKYSLTSGLIFIVIAIFAYYKIFKIPFFKTKKNSCW